MASGPPDDGSILPEGWTWGDIGHGALDIGGLVPVFGEAADLANAVWYAAQGRHLEAGLSLISMVPIVGDVIGKGGKIASKLSGPALQRLAKLLKTMDFAKTLAPFRANKKLAPHVDKMVAALERWRATIVEKACGVQGCGGKLAKTAAEEAKDAAASLAKMSPAAAREALLAMPQGMRKAVLKELVTSPHLLDVATKPGTAVFYSGRLRTSDGFISARTLAENTWRSGKTTLENTAGGSFLDKLNVYKGILPDNEADEIWTLLSGRYADGARGPVTVFMGDMRPGAVLPHELKLLKAKQAAGIVSDIKIIDMAEMFERLGR